MELFYIFCQNRIGLIDKPDFRKQHKGNIPLIGGITGGVSIYLFALFFIDDPNLNFIIYCSMLILVIGVIDDIFDIHFSYRLFFQSIIILIAIDYGIIVEELSNFNYFQNIQLGFFGIVLTFICVLD